MRVRSKSASSGNGQIHSFVWFSHGKTGNFSGGVESRSEITLGREEEAGMANPDHINRVKTAEIGRLEFPSTTLKWVTQRPGRSEVRLPTATDCDGRSQIASRPPAPGPSPS
jgi:hypothetical protein